MAKRIRPQAPKSRAVTREMENVHRIQELRRSNAAAPRRMATDYTRKPKYGKWDE